MRKYVANCAWLGLAFSVIMTVVTAILCRDILVWMKTPANIIDGAYNYIFIIFIGIPTVFLYNIVAGVIRATGDSKTPVASISIAKSTKSCLLTATPRVLTLKGICSFNIPKFS